MSKARIPRAILVAAAVPVLIAVTVVAIRWPVSAPVLTGTILVLSPHPDDETFSLPRTIHANVAAGNRVIGVLLTDGEDSQYVQWWAESSGVDLDADGDIDRWDYGLARRQEYVEAMKALGVEELVFLGAADRHGMGGLRDGSLDAGQVGRALTRLADQYDDPSILTVASFRGADLYHGETREHRDHTTLHEAASALGRERGLTVYYGKVYVYEQGLSRRWAPIVVAEDASAAAAKRAALDAYAVIGKRGMPEVWDEVRATDREYVVPGP